MQVEEEQELTVQSYLNKFEAPQIYYRAYYLTLVSSEHFDDALKILVNSKQIWMIKDVVERANKSNIQINPQYLKQAQEKINEENRSYISRSQLKNQEVMQLRQSSSRVQLRFSYKDLALIHIEAGNFSAATNDLQKTNEFNGKEKNYDFAHYYGLTTIWSQNQNIFLSVSAPQSHNANGNLNQLNDEVVLYQQYLATLALRHFSQMEFAAYLRVIKEVDLENPWIYQQLTTREDLGVYYILSALHSNKGVEFEKDLTHDKVRLLLDENQPVQQLIESYRNFDYPLMLSQLSGLLEGLKYDHHSRKILSTVKEKILTQVALQYVSAYQELSIQDLQNSFLMDGEQIMVFLENLIMDNEIPYLIDPVKHVLHRRYTPKQLEIIEFNKIQRKITERAQDDQIALMNSTFIRKDKNKQELRFLQ